MDWHFFEAWNLMSFDRKKYPKIFTALYTVIPLIPADMATRLDGTLVYVPGMVYGEAFEIKNWDRIIYLDGHIEKLSQKKANHVVAHEIAHVVLGHTDLDCQPLQGVEWDEQPREIEAVMFAEKLGFERVYKRKRAKRTMCGL